MRIDRHERDEGGTRLPFVTWSPEQPQLAVSSAALGGGIGLRHWVLNATVGRGYDRDDPAAHLTELASAAGLDGAGVGLMTAVDVGSLVHRADGGVDAWATVGVEAALWAAAPSADCAVDTTHAGTINIVVSVPVRLSEAALVNAVATATEAKAQAMADHGLDGSGTPTDAVCVLCPPDGPAEPYGGPRSLWGSRLARAVHGAVADGLIAWTAR